MHRSVVAALAAVFVLAAPAPVFASSIELRENLPLDCPDAANKFEAEMCLADLLSRHDRRLNDTYRIAMRNARAFDTEFGIPVPAASSLRTAQRLWIDYRDAACQAETAPMVLGGGGFLRAERTCLIRYTDARTRDLERLLDALPQ